MADPLLTSIAATLATGATTALTDGARELLTKLITLVRERFSHSRSDQDVLDAATSDPDDAAGVERLSDRLDRYMRDDPAFGDEVRALWSGFTAARHGGGTTNTVSGPVHGNVVQARDVHGGITFPTPPSPKLER